VFAFCFTILNTKITQKFFIKNIEKVFDFYNNDSIQILYVISFICCLVISNSLNFLKFLKQRIDYKNVKKVKNKKNFKNNKKDLLFALLL